MPTGSKSGQVTILFCSRGDTVGERRPLLAWALRFANCCNIVSDVSRICIGGIWIVQSVRFLSAHSGGALSWYFHVIVMLVGFVNLAFHTVFFLLLRLGLRSKNMQASLHACMHACVNSYMLHSLFGKVAHKHVNFPAFQPC